MICKPTKNITNVQYMSFIDVSKCTLLILIWDWIPLPQDILPFCIYCMRIHDRFPKNKSYPEICFCV